MTTTADPARAGSPDPAAPAPVRVEKVGRVGLIGLDAPPVNALGVALRRGIDAALAAHAADPEVAVIALYGCGRGFSAGADIREFGAPRAAPLLPDLLARVEACGTPVLAFLHGTALGGGLELALAAHARVARDDAVLALPEVELGLLPGAGGTQRLPRLTGTAAAIDLITTGRRIGAEEARTLGLVSEHVPAPDGTPRDAALAAAGLLLAGGIPVVRSGALPCVPDAAALEAARGRLAARRPVPEAAVRALDAIAAAGQPLAEGLKVERDLFRALAGGDAHRGLVHAFAAEREVRRFPAAEAGAPPRPLRSAGVIGGGTMGVGIATALLQAGLSVQLVETDAGRAEAACAAVARTLEGAVTRGRLGAGARDAMLARLRPETGVAALAEADLVIEAVFEDMALKTRIFAELDRVCRPGAVLGTNTSYLDLDAIAAATGRPGDVIGLHFFSPAHVMRLLEVVVGARTAPDVVATARALAAAMNKVAVRAGVCDGFIGNRMLAHYRKAADYMLLDGASFAQIDAALEGFGLAMGPFAVADLAGLDIGWATRRRLAPTRPPEERYVAIADRLCEAGRFGRKTGRGFYDYSGPGRRVPDPDAEEIVLAERARVGIVPRAFDAEEITARYLAAMVCEAARILEDGIARRPWDIDAVLLFGYGFPRQAGGPLHHADRTGLPALVARIEGWAAEDPHYWQVPDLLRRLADTGRGFADLNKE